MSWTNELEKVYELLYERKDEELLPISHSYMNIHIEITIDENGEFKGARNVGNTDESRTIVPNNGKAKTSGYTTPFLITENLKYIAGDLINFYPPPSSELDEKSLRKYEKEKNSLSERHDFFINQLTKWKESNYSHKALGAILAYLNKKTIVKDCIDSGVLVLDDKTGMLQKTQSNLSKGLTFDAVNVRFNIHYKDLFAEEKTWKDQSLQNAFIEYNRTNYGNYGLCYISGNYLPIAVTHPGGIALKKPNAKLISISTNDMYWIGRFTDKSQLATISYESSQKIHNALKWLIGKKRIHVGLDSEHPLTFLIWDSLLQNLPDIKNAPKFEIDDQSLEVDFNTKLKKFLFGRETTFNKNSQVVIMAFQATCDGRINMSMYAEIANSVFYENVSNWHNGIKFKRYDHNRNDYFESSFAIKEILNSILGIEKEEKGNIILKIEGESQEKIYKNIYIRIISCIIEGKAIPEDIMFSLFRKASNPLAYSERYNHRVVLETACGMIKKYYIDHKNMEGEKLMSYDPNNTDRSYLFGCLLAVADKLEHSTFDKEKDSKRETNARRYWSSFASRPAQMWQKIEESLLPYKAKLSPESRNYYEKCINDIMEKFTGDTFTDGRGLEPMYLLGYHHYTVKMNTYPKKNEEEE